MGRIICLDKNPSYFAVEWARILVLTSTLRAISTILFEFILQNGHHYLVAHYLLVYLDQLRFLFLQHLLGGRQLSSAGKRSETLIEFHSQQKSIICQFAIDWIDTHEAAFS